MRTLTGIAVSPGTALGPVVHMPDAIAEPQQRGAVPVGAREREWRTVEEACRRVREVLLDRAAGAHEEPRTILEATAAMAVDPGFLTAVREAVANGTPGPTAVWAVSGRLAEQVTALGGRMAARARDFLDIRDRVVADLLDLPVPGVPESAEPFVLVASDLAPADTATLDPTTVLALVTEEGGPTSHTAILARSLGLPAVVACAGAGTLAPGVQVFVDGASGEVVERPADEHRARHAAFLSRADQRYAGGCTTADGHPVMLLANVAGGPEAVEAAQAGADGVGLFRTEMCFLHRAEAPTVAEQVAAYLPVLRAFGGRRVVVRTLDAGADKPMPFVTAGGEPNPALGVRGYRTARRHPTVLADQLTAIAVAASQAEAEVWVMAPMIATPAEAAQFSAAATQSGIPRAGVMIEVPAAAVTARAVLEHVSFASIGTNDLAQYTMAADRQLSDVASLNDPWQPAVLRLVQMTVEGADGTPVGVCGEAAADPDLACVLVGLGAASLSMSWRALRPVADRLSSVTLELCRAAATSALGASGPQEARAAARAVLAGWTGDATVPAQGPGVPAVESPAPSKEDPGTLAVRATVGSREGLHARPASILAQVAATLAVPVQVGRGDGPYLPAASMVAWMSLGAARDDVLVLHAPAGADGEAALVELAEAVRQDYDHA